MKVLYLEWGCFGGREVKEYLKSVGYDLVCFSHDDFRLRQSDSFMDQGKDLLKGQEKEFAFAFSYNFYPLMARLCHEYNIKYISFVYDSPHINMYSYTITYPTNYVFVFDSTIVNEFNSNGINTVYYMPLPVDADRISQMLEKEYNRERAISQVSFVGALYNEDHNLLDNVKDLKPRTQGYIDGLIKAQSKVYGYNFIRECLKPEIIEDLQKNVNYQVHSDGIETLDYLYSDYFICRKLTSVERIDLLSEAAKQYELKLFTIDEKAEIEGAQNMGVADYFTEMPYVFHDSMINLNLSMRSIRSGIPLRCMDIMGCGGFLLSNYQEDFFKHFVPDEDFVFFESKEDMMNKIDYYLSHDKERKDIAVNGYNKVKKNHNYQVIFKSIYQIADIDCE